MAKGLRPVYSYLATVRYVALTFLIVSCVSPFLHPGGYRLANSTQLLLTLSGFWFFGFQRFHL
jgi:hypothetical protein